MLRKPACLRPPATQGARLAIGALSRATGIPVETLPHVGEPLRVPGCRSGDPPATACTRSPRSRGSSGRITRKRWPAATAARDRWCRHRHRPPAAASPRRRPSHLRRPDSLPCPPARRSPRLLYAPGRSTSNSDRLTHALLSASAHLGPLAFLETVAAPLPAPRSVRPGRRARLRGPPRALPLRAAGRRPALAARSPRRSGPAGRYLRALDAARRGPRPRSPDGRARRGVRGVPRRSTSARRRPCPTWRPSRRTWARARWP